MAQGTCSACKRVFSGITAFDKHHVQEKTQRARVICLDPAEVGLEEKSGVWGHPAPDEPLFSPATKFGEPVPAEPKTYTCACGKRYKGTGRRGRPPGSCTACGGKGELV